MKKQKKTKKQVKDDLQKIKDVAVAYETFSIDFDREATLDETEKEWMIKELSSKNKGIKIWSYDDEDEDEQS